MRAPVSPCRGWGEVDRHPSQPQVWLVAAPSPPTPLPQGERGAIGRSIHQRSTLREMTSDMPEHDSLDLVGSSTAPPRGRGLAMLFLWWGLAACSAAPPTPPARILVKLSQAQTDPTDIARLVSQAAGVEAHYQAASSPLWHALSLECRTPDHCRQSIEQLRRHPRITEVQEDGLIPRPSPPASSP